MQQRNGSASKYNAPRQVAPTASYNGRVSSKNRSNGIQENKSVVGQYRNGAGTHVVKMGFGAKNGASTSNKPPVQMMAAREYEDEEEEYSPMSSTSPDVSELLKLKELLEAKDMQILQQRQETVKLRKQNFDLTSKVLELKDQIHVFREQEKKGKAKEAREAKQARELAHEMGGLGRQNQARPMPNRPNPAAQRVGAGISMGGGNAEADEYERQLQMALQMEEMQRSRKQAEQQFMMSAMMSGGHNQAQAEEDRLIRMAMEASQADQPNDPNSPNVDNMTYEQLLEMQEKSGHVNRGLDKKDIDAIQARLWFKGKTKTDSCTICMCEYSSGERYKVLKKCQHDFHAPCLDEWLKREKTCPICKETVGPQK